jgi:hypothetical protein
MSKYLIVRCVNLKDQYECDADRTPLVLVEDYVEWLKTYAKKNEWYEVYQEGLLGELYLLTTFPSSYYSE